MKLIRIPEGVMALRELFYLLREGKFHCCWQKKPRLFEIGRTYYDGPIWYAHLWWFSIDLSYN